MTDLSTRDCQRLGPRDLLSDAELAQGLKHTAGWLAHAAGIERSFEFGDFLETMAFANAVAQIAHAQDHHPEMHISHHHCRLRFSTHSAQGVTVNDLICAARVNALRQEFIGE